MPSSAYPRARIAGASLANVLGLHETYSSRSAPRSCRQSCDHRGPRRPAEDSSRSDPAAGPGNSPRLLRRNLQKTRVFATPFSLALRPGLFDGDPARLHAQDFAPRVCQRNRKNPLPQNRSSTRLAPPVVEDDFKKVRKQVAIRLEESVGMQIENRSPAPAPAPVPHLRAFARMTRARAAPTPRALRESPPCRAPARISLALGMKAFNSGESALHSEIGTTLWLRSSTNPSFPLVHVKRRAEPVMEVRPGEDGDRSLPCDASGSLKCFAEDRFLDLELARIPDVLPMAASGGFVVGTCGLLPVRRRLEQCGHAGHRIVGLSLDEFHLDDVARRGPRNKHHALLRSRQARAAVNEFFDCDAHG